MWFLRAIISFLLDFVETIVISLAIFVLVYLFLFQPHQVDGRSMEPTFEHGEYILTDKISYRFNPPNRGDVVVFHAPQDEKTDFIKRVVGVPGDTVQLKAGYVILNGQPLNEVYLGNITTPPGRFLSEGTSLTVPENNLFVMGDNRHYSSDSREWGFVPFSNVVGRAFFRYWPPQVFGLIKTREQELNFGSVQGVLMENGN